MVLLVCLGGTAGAAASARQVTGARLPEAYLGVVRAYQAGHFEDAIERLRVLPDREPDTVKRFARLAERGVALPDPRADVAFFQAAAMLHADLAFFCWRNDCARDARKIIDFGRQLADATDNGASAPTAFRHRWYLATTFLVASLVIPDGSIEYVSDLVKEMPDDVPLLTAAGWLGELASVRPAAAGASARGQEITQRVRRQAAAGHLEAALQLDPAALEATLRLARLDVLAGHDEEAGARLEILLDREDLPPDVSYLALLLLGGIHERAGNGDMAAGEYRQALALDDVAQSARIALAHLLYARGEAKEAAAIIEPALTFDGHRERNDPWASYQLGNLAIGPELWEQLRDEVRR